MRAMTPARAMRLARRAGAVLGRRSFAAPAAGMARRAVLKEAGLPLEVEEAPVPGPEDLAEGEVLVRIDLATICGSDLHTLSGTRATAMPIVLGHEGVGTVERVGFEKAVRPRVAVPGPNMIGGTWGLREGDRVSWSLSDSCGICDECRVHRLPSKCDNLKKYGHAKLERAAPSGFSGCYATHIVLTKGTHVARLPSSAELPDAFVAPVNCALATVTNALDLQRMPRYGHNSSALVQGAGLLGIYAAAWLKYQMHMQHVFVVDVNEERLALAERFGGTPLKITSEGNFEEREAAIRALCPRGVDVVVEMAGRPEVVSEGVKLLRNGGHYSFVGMVHPQSALSAVTGENLIRKCLTIRGVHNYSPWHLDEAIHFIRTHKDRLPFEDLVGVTYGLDDINAAVAAAYSGQHARVAVNPWL